MAYRNTSNEYNYLKRRSRATYFTAMFSMALVLFFLGIFATLALFSNSFAKSSREAIVMKVFLYDGVTGDKLNELIDWLKDQPYVAQTEYLSKEKAASLYLDRTGEEILEAMDGINPLLASINLKFSGDYLQHDSLQAIQDRVQDHVLVADVYYPFEMLYAVSDNVNTLTITSLAVAAVVVLVAFFLIFNTIRLAIYAKRLNIRSMQLIGATRAFIRRPFLRNGLTQGFLAGLAAAALLVLALVMINLRLPLVDFQTDAFFRSSFIGILGGIVLFGTALGLTGSYLAVNRYLSRDLDELMR